MVIGAPTFGRPRPHVKRPLALAWTRCTLAPMKRVAAAALTASLLAAGCATQSASRAPGTTFTGEVWTWDENESTVTLRDGMEQVRVKVTPDQIRGLRLHQI